MHRCAALQLDKTNDIGGVQVGVKEAKLRAKQAQEMDLLQGRGARGKDQLKRAHAQVCCTPGYWQLHTHSLAFANIQTPFVLAPLAPPL